MRTARLQQVVRDEQIGAVLVSEVDDQATTAALPPQTLVNTWSVSGFLAEAFGTRLTLFSPSVCVVFDCGCCRVLLLLFLFVVLY